MKIVVMLIWMGVGSHGGPATIQGFDSLAACEAARAAVADGFRGLSWSTHTSVCVELNK